MHPEDRVKIDFITPVAFFKFNRMPQGLSGAPATFQRLMEKTVGGMNLIQGLVYLDDIIIFGKTLEEHEEHLKKVLKRLHDDGFKLFLEKCHFCQPSINNLGHVVSAEGVATDPQKLEAVTSWSRSTNVTKLRTFVGFRSYYRRFVERIAKIANLSNELLKNEDDNPDLTKPAKPTHIFQYPHENITHTLQAPIYKNTDCTP